MDVEPALAAVFGLLLFSAVFAVRNWQYGVLLCLVVGVLQDLLRKSTTGQSPLFVLLVAACFGLIILSVLARRFPLTTHDQLIWRRELRIPFTIFLFWLGFQAVMSYLNYGNIRLVGVGLMSYVAVLPAVLVGYHYALQTGTTGLIRWMAVYVAVALVGLATVYLEFAGYQSSLLGEVGVGIRIYDLGTILDAHSGIFRASEVAGWHAATAASFIIILALARNVTLSRLLIALALAGAVIGIGMLTGRRKMAVQFVIFCLVFFALLLRSDRQSRAVLTVASMLAFAIGIGVNLDFSGGFGAGFGLYLTRTSSVFGDIWERFVGLGLEPISWAYNRFGWLGGGLGVGTSAAQHTTSAGFGGAGEGGLGKLMAELGAPGLLLAAWLMILLARLVLRAVTYVGRFQGPPGRIASGMFAFLISNVATFIVATPVFSDFNILLMLGVAMGFIVACPGIELALRRNPHRSHGPSPRTHRVNQPTRPERHIADPIESPG